MKTAFDRDVWAILGMPLDNVSLDEAASLIEQAVETRSRLSFVTPNVNWLVRALTSDDAMRQIVNADLSLADGAPVVWLARQLGMPLKERVAGADLFQKLRTERSKTAIPIRVFFFGGRDGAAQTAHNTLLRETGRLVAAGWHNPGFGTVETMSGADIHAKINAARPDFLIVSLGAEKGQTWIEHNQDSLDVPVIAHLGAVVDFVAGSIRRAPAWVSKVGLEWVWRIFAEPSLWKRYWRDGMALLSVVRTRLGTLKKASKPVSSPSVFSAARDEETLKLTGDLIHEHRGALRNSLSTIAHDSGDCTLDFTEVQAIDASALGQVRMLEQTVTRRGNRLQILASNKTKPALIAANMTLQGVL